MLPESCLMGIEHLAARVVDADRTYFNFQIHVSAQHAPLTFTGLEFLDQDPKRLDAIMNAPQTVDGKR